MRPRARTEPSGEDRQTDLIDRSRETRPGEELGVERLANYLRESVPELSEAPRFEIEQFPSGHSNLTYLLRAGGREYVLRRPPFGSKVKSAHDMGREYRILSKLHRVYPLAPEPIAFCQDHDVIGADFYVMRRLTGIIIRKQLPPGLELGPDRIRALHAALVDNLVSLHSLDYVAAGLGDLGKPEGYVERQVTGWTKRYDGSRTDDIPSVDRVARWLAEHLPPEGSPALIHNDYKLDNVVLAVDDPTRIIGVLDWEMSTIGDPSMDLGTTLSYWIEAGDDGPMHALAWGPTHAPGAMTRRDIAEYYAEKSGRDTTDALFYYAFGLFKTAVVAQQIYYRYKQGLTKDERFAMMIMGVHVLCNQAVKAIETGRL
jgi:aminoglycoside phosphotransferase (APT) family kinase protein